MFIFDNRTGKSPYSKLYVVQPTKGFWGNIKEETNSILVFSKEDNLTYNVIDSFDIPHPTDGKTLQFTNSVYFPEVFNPTIDIENNLPNKPQFARYLNRFAYRDYKFVLQTLTIPIKFRRPINDLPYQAETSFPIGLGAGIKWSYNWYKPTKSFLGQKTNQVSFTPGILASIGATDIVANVTAPADFKNRKEPIFTYGLFFMVGFNSINIGIAFGQDQALKDGGKANGWYYDGKSWTGIIIGFDLIK